MRNWTKIFIAVILVAVWIVSMIVLPKQIKEESPMFDIGIITAGFCLFVWLTTLLAAKYSYRFSAFGVNTTLEQPTPVDGLKMKDIKDGKEYEFGLFPHGGIKALAMAGGGTSGYSIVRTDLIQNIEGDNSNVWVFGVPDIYQLDAPAGGAIMDLRELPLRMYQMVQRHKNWHPKSTVMVFWDPPTKNMIDRDVMKKLPTVNFENLYGDANKIILEQKKQINNLLSANSKYARTNKDNATSYSRDPRDEKGRRPKEDEDDDDED
jgi:hypothetical protein